MTLEIIRIAASLLIVLTATNALAKERFGFLPLGGNHATEMGIVLGLAFVVVEFSTVVSHS